MNEYNEFGFGHRGGPASHQPAQICLNGHVVNDSTRTSPEFNQDHCQECGAATIMACLDCKSAIQGSYEDPGVISMPMIDIPKFCGKCGAPYPWTTAKLRAANALAAEFEEWSDEDRTILEKSLDDLVKDTPQSQVAAVRTKKLVLKLGKEAGGLMRDLLKDIVSDAARKILWPSG